jgi:hypothetical protein
VRSTLTDSRATGAAGISGGAGVTAGGVTTTMGVRLEDPEQAPSVNPQAMVVSKRRMAVI